MHFSRKKILSKPIKEKFPGDVPPEQFICRQDGAASNMSEQSPCCFLKDDISGAEEKQSGRIPTGCCS